MKIVSWNVNGIRACTGKGFCEFIKNVNADIICLQEIKIHEPLEILELNKYNKCWNHAQKKGYSGTAVFSKFNFKNVDTSLFDDTEGRIIALEYENFYLVNCYIPQARRDLSRLEYRLNFDKKLTEFLKNLERYKPVILCGDLNVAHQEIDLKNPKSNSGHSGFTIEERESFSNLLNEGFIDTFRYFYPDKKDSYTWWSYRKDVRKKNIGWRIDYFVISESLKNNLVNSLIYNEVQGSDHCPIGIEIRI